MLLDVITDNSVLNLIYIKNEKQSRYIYDPKYTLLLTKNFIRL